MADEYTDDPEMARARDLAAQWQQAARDEQERAGIQPQRRGHDGRWEFCLAAGSFVRLWHEPHSMSGTVRGLRPVSDGGPLALLIDDLGAYGLRAARPADGSAWAQDVTTTATWLNGSDVLVELWPVADADVLRSPREIPAWQVEEWQMRTHRPKEQRR